MRLFVVLMVLLGGFGLPRAEAQEAVSYAGIVIRPGDGTVTYAYVPLDEPVSGIELLRRSGVSLVTVGFGGLGEGVCQIEETGCDVGPCRTRLLPDRRSGFALLALFSGGRLREVGCVSPGWERDTGRARGYRRLVVDARRAHCCQRSRLATFPRSQESMTSRIRRIPLVMTLAER